MTAVANADVDAYRNTIFLTYAGAGFLIAEVFLFSVQDSMLSEVSSTVAAAFTLIIATFTWIGGAIANAVHSRDDAANPWANGRAIVRSLPQGVAAIAVTLAVVLLAMQIPAPGVMYFAGLGFGAWVRWRVKTGDRPA
jgi:hypothetical protein